MESQVKKLSDKIPRMSGWTLITIGLVAAIWVVSPKQLEVVAYKTLLLTLAVVLSYHADRAIFKRVRDRLGPDMPRDIFAAARLLSRALIFLGCVLGLTLGL